MIWTVIKEKAQEEGLPLRTVVSEVLHIAALDAIFSIPESESIFFQGGTSIHLLHGGYRYSEDLDFAGKKVTSELSELIINKSRSPLEKNIIQLLGNGHIEWRNPPASLHHRIYTYWILYQPDGIRQKFRLKFEFAAFPIYHPKVYAVRSKLDLLQRIPLVNGLTPEELLAEKISAVIGRPYFKGRDIFDLWYLKKVMGVSTDAALVWQKLLDYGDSCVSSEVKKKLDASDSKTLEGEMTRFLPQRYRNHLQRSAYEEIRQTAVESVLSVLDELGPLRG